MSWDDWVLGIATGGVYNLGKAAYNAMEGIGEASSSAGPAVEQAGSAIATMATTLQAVGDQLKSLLAEAEELLTIRRMSPRGEDELWEEEKERLADLRKELADIEASISKASNIIEMLILMIRLESVKCGINEILYEEPGILSEFIYNSKETLERFNTLEQPRIEEILDSVEDNLETSEEILHEVKKLFVIKKRVPIPISELSSDSINKLDRLRSELEHCKLLNERKSTLALQLKNVMEKIPEKRIDINDKWIKPIQGIQEGPFIEGINRVETSALEKLNNLESLQVSIVETMKVEENSRKDTSETMEKITGSGTEEPLKHVEPVQKTDNTVKLSEKASYKNPEAGFEEIKSNFTENGLQIPKKSRTITGTRQPEAAKIAVSLNTKYDSFRKNYEFINAHTAFTERRIDKIDRKIDLISHIYKEEPGLIPKTLEEVHGVLEHLRTEEQVRIDSVLDILKKDLEETSNTIEHFRKEEQPRIDSTLDGINKNLEESEKALSKMCDSLDSVKGGLLFLEKNSGIIKTGLFVMGGLVGLNLFFGLIVLVRAALGL